MRHKGIEKVVVSGNIQGGRGRVRLRIHDNGEWEH